MIKEIISQYISFITSGCISQSNFIQTVYFYAKSHSCSNPDDNFSQDLFSSCYNTLYITESRSLKIASSITQSLYTAGGRGGGGWGVMILFLLFLPFHSCSLSSLFLFHLHYYPFYLSSLFLWETTQNDPQGMTCR